MTGLMRQRSLKLNRPNLPDKPANAEIVMAKNLLNPVYCYLQKLVIYIFVKNLQSQLIDDLGMAILCHVWRLSLTLMACYLGETSPNLGTARWRWYASD